MINHLFLFCCIFASIVWEQGKSQDYIAYNRSIEEVKYLLYKGDSIVAEDIYSKQIGAIDKPFLRDIRDLVRLRLQLGKTKQLDTLVIYGFPYGMSREYLMCDSTLNAHYGGRWETHFPMYDRMRKEYMTTIDTAYRREIITLINLDQKYRSLCNEDTPAVDSLRRVNDNIVLGKLKQLIATKGYFGFSRIGEDILWGGDSDNFTEVFFRHMEPDSNKVYFYSILADAMGNGDLYPDSYAGIIDYDWIKRDAFKSYFGTVSFLYKQEKYAFPLVDGKNIDSIRNSVGLIGWIRHLELCKTRYDTTLRLW